MPRNVMTAIHNQLNRQTRETVDTVSVRIACGPRDSDSLLGDFDLAEESLHKL